MSLLCWLFGHKTDTYRLLTVNVEYDGRDASAYPATKVVDHCRRCGHEDVTIEERDPIDER